MKENKHSKLSAVIAPHDAGGEEYVSREGRNISHVDAVTMVDDECECAMFELNSLCMTRHPDFKAIIHQLRRLRECKASRKAVREAVLQQLTFQVACSPETEREKTLKNWSVILEYPLVHKWLELTRVQYDAAVTAGSEIRNAVKTKIAEQKTASDDASLDDLVMESVVSRVLTSDLTKQEP